MQTTTISYILNNIKQNVTEELSNIFAENIAVVSNTETTITTNPTATENIDLHPVKWIILIFAGLIGLYFLYKCFPYQQIAQIRSQSDRNSNRIISEFYLESL